MLITRRHGSWVVLGTLVTTAELEATPPLDAGCGSCTLCIDACPTDALDEAGRARRDALPLVLDAVGRRRSPRSTARRSATASTAATSARTSARGTAASRSGARGRRAENAEPHVSLVDWLRGGRRRARRRATTASSCRATTRATCAGTRSSRSATQAAEHRRVADALRRERRSAAARARGVGASEAAAERRAAAPAATPSAGSRWVRLGAVPLAVFQVAIGQHYPAGYELWAWLTTAALAVGALAIFALSRRELTKQALQRIGLAALAFDFAIVSAYTLIFSFEPASPDPPGDVPAARRGRAALRDRGRARGGRSRSAPVMAGFEWLRARPVRAAHATASTTSRSSSGSRC